MNLIVPAEMAVEGKRIEFERELAMAKTDRRYTTPSGLYRIRWSERSSIALTTEDEEEGKQPQSLRDQNGEGKDDL